jgi:hypothetical protein
LQNVSCKASSLNHFEDFGVDGRIILKFNLEIQFAGVNCIQLAEDKD